ncbi:125 kDa kinesin-related protein [Platanthera zijinensis]|uniref:Kinesin-like protein n=1 Tax=Platanthera zijinensis TaxID=2320716 RepID=A0AAP0G4T7_9ASPA
MSASSRDKDKSVNVQVLLRCRPFSEDELRSNAPQVVTCNDFQKEVAVSQTIAGKQIDRVFTFDKVFGPCAKQKDLYEQAIVPIVNEVLEGFNCTIFAYGQTGTGKTHTMEGECRRAKSGPKGQLPVDAGVIPRAVKQIFDALEGQHTEYSVKVTFLELYNEEITDLLAPEELSKISLEDKQKKQLPLMEDGKGGVLVRGLDEEIVTCADEIFSLLERGSSKRRTAETLLNKQSSRSHSLFSITIHIKEATPEGEELIKCGKLNLVDLAGSENISRSGAREGRAREAGEINKSLLTLGRVITALVEHLGHIPYRDSKLTRLLRDSLGGRTKTCIIATVNQKMMKSTLIKDLYGEIDRLKAVKKLLFPEVYATREKVGVYIPKERYYQEECERKTMAEQIEQMSTMLESNQKQIDDLQGKYDAQLQQSADLNKKLDATEESLDHTNKILATTREDLQQTCYHLKERDYIIAEQRKAENALAHQACVLRSDLEKSIQDNTSLFSKIAREDQLNATNRSLVDKFQADLAERINTICNLVVASIEQQNKHLHSIEKLSHSCLDFHDKALMELKKKVSTSKLMYTSHMEGLQNAICLHKATNNACLEELSSVTSTNSCSLDHLLAVGGSSANIIFTDLQGSLSNYRGEIAQFMRELRERFNTSLDHTKEISSFVFELIDELKEKSEKLQSHSSWVHEVQTQGITEFQKAHEVLTRLETEKLIAQVTSWVSTHMHRQKELVDTRLNGFREAALENKTFVDKYTSSMASVTGDAKRKWEEFYLQMQHDSKDGLDLSSVKHCRLEAIAQQCVNTVEDASHQREKVHESASQMSSKHVEDMEALVRNAMESNDQHDAEVDMACNLAMQDAQRNSTDIIAHFDTVLEHDRKSVAGVMSEVEAHSTCLQELSGEHNDLASNINFCARVTFQHDYAVYEASGNTPTRCEADVPSKGTIESLRTMPIDALLGEFRENNPYESTKLLKPSLIARPPLIQLN